MLEQSILEIAIATCFSSQALANKLEADLLASSAISTMDKSAFHAACQAALRGDLDHDYPRRFRRNDIEKALDVVWHKHMLIGTNGAAMPFLDHLFERLLIAHGDHIQYRDGQAQAYARFAARIDPALLVSWRLAKRVRERPFLKAHDLLRLISAQQPFFAPLAVAEKAFAESHVHVGGVHGAGMALMAGLLPNVPLANDKTKETKQSKNSKNSKNAKAAHNSKPKESPALIKLRRLAQGLLQSESLIPLDASTCTTCTEVAREAKQAEAKKDDAKKENSKADDTNAEDISISIQTVIKNSIGMQAISHAPNPVPWAWFVQQAETVRADNPRWLRQQIARNIIVHQDLGQAWMWFLVWLWVHYQHPNCDTRLRMAILYLLNGLMHVRRELIVDGQGLSRFVEYYGRTIRKAPNDVSAISAAKALFQGADDVAELKVMGDRFQPKNIATWLKQLARATGVPPIPELRPLPAYAVQQHRAMMERWHYCIHFSRGKDFLHAPKKVWEATRELQKNLEAQAGWNLPEMLGNQEQQNLANARPMRLVPSRWLRGLDVAGDENLSKTEIYAPALRWLREGMRGKPESELASDGLHLSIHAGEDYAHPLSGMRHIDETVQFCEMRAGDRLGHALAIGILASEWVRAHGEMLLPVEEHLDNLVWAWHYASLMASRLPLAAQVVPILERRIHKILPFVPWAHVGCLMMDKESESANQPKPVRRCASAARLQAIKPEQLFQAWLLRRNCSDQLDHYDNQGEIKDRRVELALPDRKKLTTCCDQDEDLHDQHDQVKSSTPSKTIYTYPPDVALYRKRWEWLAQQTVGKAPPNKGCDKLGTVTTVRIRLECNLHEEFTCSTDDLDRTLVDDSHSPQELEFFDALQDWLLDAYDQKGLMIEANPTSNVYIARLSEHAEHPIFRWYPPNEDWLKPGEKHNRYGLRRGPIKVCVNTDDPGIMPTTLRTEFALLREAALQHGVSRTDAESWLERLRLFGLNEFRQKHQAVWVPYTSLSGSI